MKYSNEDYEKLVLALNMNKNKKIIWIGTIISVFLIFGITTLIEEDFYFNLVLSIGGSIVVYFSSKKSIYNSAKKVNFIKNIISIEQEIYEDKIVEKVLKTDGCENVGEYYYKDFIFVKEGKRHYYLYLNSNAAIIVDKEKLENKENFDKILKINNLK